ncbi:acyloxyacyl hydrolase [Neptunicella marina]|uniref:Lipid A deacylase n=2 Tax=Neptunicella marina TaxID=2125989 RepID=A0A8J6IWY2_9ALTE|nr:acyloxyacyl hydrolase [Neptunicella marina]
MLLVMITLINVLLVWQAKAAGHAVAIDYIHGEGGVDGIKLAYQRHSDVLQRFSPLLDLYFESSVNFWQYGDNNQHDTNFVLAISPVIQYEVSRWNHNPVLVEFGIGVSLLDDTQFAGKNVSTHYQFEDRLGIVYRFGQAQQYRVALRYLHYSNAGFKRPNPGLDFVSLSFSRHF